MDKGRVLTLDKIDRKNRDSIINILQSKYLDIQYVSLEDLNSYYSSCKIIEIFSIKHNIEEVVNKFIGSSGLLGVNSTSIYFFKLKCRGSSSSP